MEKRTSRILELRPDVPAANISNKMGADELFQNKTLRPVIVLQNDLLVEAFRNYIKKHKNVFLQLDVEKRLKYIENAIQKDIKFRNSLKGMVIGQFTTEEYILYTANSSALNKRMMNLVIVCIQNSIQLLEGEVVH